MKQHICQFLLFKPDLKVWIIFDYSITKYGNLMNIKTNSCDLSLSPIQLVNYWFNSCACIVMNE
jgi:hypothetical protein